MSIRQPAICVVTRGRGSADSSERAALLERLESAASAGATIVQIRERQFDDRELVRFTEQVADAVRPHRVLVAVNERVDIALAAGAGGVHLKSNSPPVSDVRRIVPAEFVVGRSVHSVEEAVAAERSGGCDYLFFGTVFPSTSKPADHVVAGVEALERVCHAVALPVIAIGGISRERAPLVVRAGAAGIAAISLFADSRDIASTVREVHDALTLPSRNV